MNNSFLTLYYPYGQRPRDLNQHKSPYGRLALVGKALWQAGVFNIPILRHPVTLQLQMLSRNNSYLFGLKN